MHLSKHSLRLSQTDFFERWKQIGGAPREAQIIFPISLKAGSVDGQKTNEIFTGNRFSVLPSVDPNPGNFVAAAVLHMSVIGKVGCLVRYEPNQNAKVGFSYALIASSDIYTQLARLTLRTTNEDVSIKLLDVLQTQLSSKN